MMIDTHCHLSKKDYDNLEEIIDYMNGNIMIVSTCNQGDLDETLELCNKYSNIYACFGLHPECADSYNEKDLLEIEKKLTNPKVVGVGEIGLDYHYTKDNKEKQKELFIKQINLAIKYHKPVVIHSRDAIEETYNIIKQYQNQTKFHIHCFDSTPAFAKKFVELGCTLGIGGIVTFKKEKNLKEVVNELELKNLCLETDSPYLTPEPYRGKQNEPYNIYFVATAIAEIKNIDLKIVLESTTETAKELFNLNI